MDLAAVLSRADSALERAYASISLPIVQNMISLYKRIYLQLDLYTERMVAEGAVEHRLELGFRLRLLHLRCFFLSHGL